MIVQKGFRSNKDLLDDFSEICKKNGLSDSACLNRLIWLYVSNDTMIQQRCNDISIIQSFQVSYGE